MVEGVHSGQVVCAHQIHKEQVTKEKLKVVLPNTLSHKYTMVISDVDRVTALPAVGGELLFLWCFGLGEGAGRVIESSEGGCVDEDEVEEVNETVVGDDRREVVDVHVQGVADREKLED